VFQLVSDAGEDVGKHGCADEDQRGAKPVIESERVVKVRDGDEQGEEFTQSDDECHCQRCTLGGQYKHWPDADVSSETL